MLALESLAHKLYHTLSPVWGLHQFPVYFSRAEALPRDQGWSYRLVNGLSSHSLIQMTAFASTVGLWEVVYMNHLEGYSLFLAPIQGH